MIYFTPTAYQKIKYFTLNAEGEVSGLGKSKFLGDDIILVTDIVILKQVNTFVSTDLDEEAMAQFLNKKMINNEETEDWNIWWHTHADFDVFWSSTDNETIEEATGGPLLISIVTNKEMEMLGRIDIFDPLRLTCNLPICKSKGRPKEIKNYLKTICQGRINKCLDKQKYRTTRFLRQTRLFNPEHLQESITIIGAGNIGSMVAYGLAKLGLRSILVYDFDKVEEHNLASQFYGINDIGKLKTECLKNHIKEFTGTEISIDKKFINQPVYGILIIAVDSMPERERISKVINKQANQIKQIIDGRMGGNTIEIYTVKTPSEYKKTLVKHVVNVPCSERYISYTSLICGGIITDQVKRYLNEEKISQNILFDVDMFKIIS